MLIVQMKKNLRNHSRFWQESCVEEKMEAVIPGQDSAENGGHTCQISYQIVSEKSWGEFYYPQH